MPRSPTIRIGGSRWTARRSRRCAATSAGSRRCCRRAQARSSSATSTGRASSSSPPASSWASPASPLPSGSRRAFHSRQTGEGMFRGVYRKALLIGVNVAVLALLLEASALAYFLLRDGHLYYSAREEIVKNRASEMATGLNGTDPGELRRRLREGLSQMKYRLNPYYGFQYIANSRVPVEAFHVPRTEAAANCKYRV